MTLLSNSLNRADRSRSFKVGITADAGRRRRDDTRVQLRKSKKEDSLMKRRAMGAGAVGAGAGGTAMNTAAATGASSASAAPPANSKVYTVSDIPQLYNSITTYSDVNDPSVLEGIRAFRRILSVESNPPCEEVIQCGALPHIVRLLACENAEIQFEAAWALTNVASADSDCTIAVAESGAVPHLVAQLRSADPNVREQCAWCLGNISGDSPALRDTVLQSGAMEGILLNIAQPASSALLGNVVWTLSNLCRGKPQPDLHMVSPALPHLASLLSNPSTPNEVMVDVAWALSYLSDGDDQRIQACQDANITNRLVELLSSDQPNLVTPCLRTLGNFVSGSDGQTQAVVDANVLGMMKQLLSHRRKNIRKESCWLLSNIAAGTHIQIGSVIHRAGLITAVVDALNNDQWEVRKEATWVISNVCTGGTTQHIESLVEAGAIEALCGILDSADAKIIAVALEALEAILKTGEALNKVAGYVSLVDESGGIDHIEGLQEHENDDIYEKAISIIEKYFGCDDAQEDENLAPVVSGNTFAFGVDATKAEGEAAAPSFNFADQPQMAFNFAT